MGAPKYHQGQTVALIIRIGRELEKRHLGEIQQVGQRGMFCVRLAGDGRVVWVPSSQIRPTGSDERPEVVELPAEPATPRLAVVPPPAAVVAPPEPAEVDPIAAWLAQGRQLLAVARSQVEREEAAVSHADHEVDEARQLLAATEATAQGARTRLRSALERLAEVERRTGGA